MASSRDHTLTLAPQNHAFNNWLRSFKTTAPVNYPVKDLSLFHKLIKPELLRVISLEVNRLGPVKVSYTMRIKLRKDTNKGAEFSNFFFRQDVPIFINSFNPGLIIGKLSAAVNNNKELISLWVDKSSGWVVDRF